MTSITVSHDFLWAWKGEQRYFMVTKYVHCRHFNSKYKIVSEKGNNNCIFIIKQGNVKHVCDTPYISLSPGKPIHSLESLFRDSMFQELRTREVQVIGLGQQRAVKVVATQVKATIGKDQRSSMVYLLRKMKLKSGFAIMDNSAG